MELSINALTTLFENNIVLRQLFSAVSQLKLPNIIISQELITLFNLFLIFLLTVSILYLVVKIIRALLQIYFHIKEQYAYLEVKPPQETLQSSYTTQQLFTLLHGLAQQRHWLQRLIGAQKVYSFELVSTKNEGIRYFLRVNVDDIDIVKKGLLSYLPGISVTEVTDYLPPALDKKCHITQFKLSSHFAFPLKRQDELKEHDPIAYMTGNMTKLASDELIAFQLVASPLPKNQTDIKTIFKLIYQGRDLVTGLRTQTGILGLVSLLRTILFLAFYLLTLPLGLFVFLMSNGKEGPFLSTPFNQVKKKTANPYQEELEILVKAKLDRPLFTTNLRLLVIGNHDTTQKRARGFSTSLATFSNSYQTLRKARSINLDLFKKINLVSFKYRLLSPFSKLILSTSEVADLYHFPYTRTTRTEDIQKLHSKELPAPVALKKAQNLDVIFAKNTYGGTSTDIGLTEDERRRHMYILGATGTGKSTLLLSMINQDLNNGKGICVIDPHGELIENILPLIPEERIKDVIYFNPDDISFPVGLNLLELPSDITGDVLLREKELITESIISLFHKIYDDKYSGPRMEYILRNTIHTAFLTPNPTLFTVYKLLINEDFRKKVTKDIQEENLHDFWKYEFSKAGDYQKVKMISPITNKIGRFLFSPTAKRILEQEKSTINFDDIMNSGKILLCNVSKGKIGEDNSQVFGTLILAKIQLAALKRARTKSNQRRDFYLYVDEFQNFATPSFAQILSEARKYKLNAILAHQTTSQLEDKSLVNVTLANTGTIICFRTANPEDERLILPQFIPYVQPGEIDNLPSFHFYIKISALRPEEPFSGETLPVAIPDDEQKVQQIIDHSRQLFATEFKAQAVIAKPDKPKYQPKKSIQTRVVSAFPD